MRNKLIESKYRYKETISEEELLKFKTESFEGKIILVEKKSDCKRDISHIREQKVVGIDTESKPVFKSGQQSKISLIQISLDDCCYLFRINKIGITPEIVQFIEDPNIYKIGLDLRGDIRAINKIEPINHQKFIEIQKICPAYGIKEQGLQKIYGIIFNKYINKEQRLSDWNEKQLSIQQLQYAALDAWAVLRIYKELVSLPNPNPANYAIIN